MIKIGRERGEKAEEEELSSSGGLGGWKMKVEEGRKGKGKAVM